MMQFSTNNSQGLYCEEKHGKVRDKETNVFCLVLFLG